MRFPRFQLLVIPSPRGCPRSRGVPGTMTSTYNSGLGQFFSAEKLAVQARKNEAKDIPWTANEKAVNWGGWTVCLGGPGKGLPWLE